MSRRVWIKIDTAALNALSAAAVGVLRGEARSHADGGWRIPVDLQVRDALQAQRKRLGFKSYSAVILKLAGGRLN